MSNWTADNIPSQHGRTAIVTGTGGIGLEVALELARAGADVLLAGRNPTKGAGAIARIRGEAGATASARFVPLDLADLSSVAAFCARVEGQPVDFLINNAGIMVPPTRQESANGFELQLATNYLGHFALTAGLLSSLRKATAARVVSVSSVAARNGELDFTDLNAERSYEPMPVYARSKLACLMFALELDRRSKAQGWGIDSIAAHPGVSRTDLLHNAPGRRSVMGLVRSLLWFLFQPAAQGALPLLYAATAPEAQDGAYYGPNRLSETRGFPASAVIPPQALDAADARQLWEETERMTGVRFPT